MRLTLIQTPLQRIPFGDGFRAVLAITTASACSASCCFFMFPLREFRTDNLIH